MSRWEKVKDDTPWTPAIGWDRNIDGWSVWLRLCRDSKWLLSVLSNKNHDLDWTIRYWLHARKTSTHSVVKMEAAKAFRKLRRTLKETET